MKKYTSKVARVFAAAVIASSMVSVMPVVTENCAFEVSAASKTKKELLPAPSGLKGEATDTAVTLTWNKVSGASGYRIFMYNEKTKEFERKKDVRDTSATIKGLTKNTEYKFKICAYVKDDKGVKNQTMTEPISIKTLTKLDGVYHMNGKIYYYSYGKKEKNCTIILKGYAYKFGADGKGKEIDRKNAVKDFSDSLKDKNKLASIFLKDWWYSIDSIWLYDYDQGSNYNLEELKDSTAEYLGVTLKSHNDKSSEIDEFCKSAGYSVKGDASWLTVYDNDLNKVLDYAFFSSSRNSVVYFYINSND